jgi:hypothetical protein
MTLEMGVNRRFLIVRRVKMYGMTGEQHIQYQNKECLKCKKNIKGSGFL